MKKLAKITEGLIGQPMINIFTKVREMERAGRKVYHFENLGIRIMSLINILEKPLRRH
ncbi:MAG: hypothetical protein JRJ65_05335 [Deltaproteobacteria bacterium]|nr:hypothetical protein [Deltaproteobacteria bacterium]